MIKLKRQKPIKGGRKSLPSCVIKNIKDKIDHIARYHRVSRSFVIATILAKELGVKIEYYYE